MPRSREVQANQRARRHSARLRILDTTKALLADHPWSEVSIQDIMSASGVSRTSFYRHFDDGQHLLLTLLEEVGHRTGAPAEKWLGATGDPVEALRAAVAELVSVYETHGPILQAIAEAAAQDSEIDAVYHQVAEGFVQTVAARIVIDVNAGASEVGDATETARALVWMSERYLAESLGRKPHSDLATVRTTMFEIWTRAVYGKLPS
ncbi:MAG TPA: TetR/AcrR family transcriptional regulator [Acidimicrobiales bacterium]|nr:TetR/AcrR family transcriptional regulator [Acidimicrobiales bacterium]